MAASRSERARKESPPLASHRPTKVSEPSGEPSLPVEAFSILHADPHPLALLDERGLILQSNPAFERLIGASGAVASLVAAVLARAVRERQENGDGPPVLFDPPGVALKAHLVKLPNPAGAAIFAAFFSDISDEAAQLRQAKAQQAYLQNVLRSCSDWLWATDTAGRLTEISGAMTRILGRPSKHLLGGRFADFAAWTAPEVADFTELPEYRSRVAFRDYEIAVRDMRGGEHRQRVAGVPQFDADSGAFLGYCGTGLDLSQQAAIEAALSASRVKLEATAAELRTRNVELQHALTASEAASLAKNQFLASMSHELKTPLNAVLGYAEAMATGAIRPDAAQQQRIAGHIQSAGQLLLRLIEDVLEMARLDNDQVKVVCAAEPLTAVLQSAYSCVAQAAAAKGTVLQPLDTDDGTVVFVDRVRTVQIFVNLLTNAVKYTPSGTQVGIRVGAARNSTVEVAVWDSGPGIAPEKRDKIFTAFSRLDSDAYRSTAVGTGLGLTISRRLAALMGGWLEMREHLGGGCEFVVRLRLNANEP